jgi:hypothetical protein
MGSTQSNHKDVTQYTSDPATYVAGLCVSVGSDNLLTLTAGPVKAGVSLGKTLSGDSKITSVLRAGEKVSVLAHLKRASGVVTISSYANLVSGTDDALTIAGTAFTAQAGSATPGDATFQAATSNGDTATSLAAQINAHSTVSAKVYAVASSATVTLYSVVDGVGGTGTGNDIAVSYTDNDANVGITLSGLSGGKLSGGSNSISAINYVTKGGHMYINDATGKADKNIVGFTTISNAIYRQGPITGVAEDGSDVAAVIVDMVGGL